MKKIISFALLISIFVLNSGAGCSTEEDEPKPDNFSSMVGKWKLHSYILTKVLDDGRVESAKWFAQEHNVNVSWDFQSNGVFIASTDTSKAQGTWELKVLKANGGLIDEGILTLTGAGTEQTAAALTGQPKLSGVIYTVQGAGENSFTITFEVDVALGYYPETRRVSIMYTYRKI
jgi:hypothetical protein